MTYDPATGLITGTPTQSGNFPITITATSPQGNGTATVSMAVSGVTPLPAAPVVTSPTDAAAQLGAEFAYQITATNSPTSYGATGLPDGLTVDATTGLISGTPTTTGNFSFVISASNAGGTGVSTVSTQVADQLPVITIRAMSSSVRVGSGELGKFMLTRTGDTSGILLINYKVTGDAIPDVDYAKRRGVKRFKAGRGTVFVSIYPEGDLNGYSYKKVKLTLKASDNYTVGAPGKAKMRITQ